MLLAAKMMEHDPNAFPEVDPAHLRVREFASNDPKWVGAIFMDKQVCLLVPLLDALVIAARRWRLESYQIVDCLISRQSLSL
eukprot:SAG31_NODE_366_length_16817_cov_17.317921_8_plen_82_part_00